MDNKRLIITVTALMILVLTWNQIFVFIAKRQGWDISPKTLPETASVSTTQPTDAAMAPTTQSSAMTGPTTSVAGGSIASNPPTVVALGSTANAAPDFHVGLTVVSRGAGLGSVTLNDYKQSIDSAHPFVYEIPHFGYEDLSRPLASRSVTIDGTTHDLANVDWKLEHSDTNSAKYSLDLSDGDKPLVRIEKTYQVFPRADADDGNGLGWEVLVTQNIVNRTARALSINSRFVGPVPPPREMERGGDRQIITGYRQSDTIELVHHTVEEFTNKPAKDLSVGENNAPLAWAGACSGYFDAIVRPVNLGSMTAVSAVDLVNDPNALERHVAMTYDSTGSLAAGATDSFPVRVFFGPKLRTLLKNNYYSEYPKHYDSTLVMTSGPCSYCTSDVLINVLVKSLVAFHWVLRDWGLAIIALVICVRAILHPIMKRSQTNMMKMGRMGPEIERLKKKYGDDKDAVAKAQMQLMKEQGFTPILGCLPMFLQMPIFIALWSCLQSTFELRQAPFLYFFHTHFTWIKDLSQPDKLIWFPGHPISFFFIHFDAINLLPLLVAVVSFINQKVTPKPPAATPEAEQQQKMMQWMTLVFPLMFYNLPSGLNLYYVTSTSIGILEGKIIRRHIKEREAAEKGDRIIIDAKPTRGSKMKKRDDPPKDQQKVGGLRGWLASLQEKAEQIQRDSDRRNKDRA